MKVLNGNTMVYIILTIAVILALLLSYFMGKNKLLSTKVEVFEGSNTLESKKNEESD